MWYEDTAEVGIDARCFCARFFYLWSHIGIDKSGFTRASYMQAKQMDLHMAKKEFENSLEAAGKVEGIYGASCFWRNKQQLDSELHWIIKGVSDHFDTDEFMRKWERGL